jgi:peptidoglycan-associated lipoprotein
MSHIIRIGLSATLIGSIVGCTNFVNRFNGYADEQEHIIVVLPRAPMQTQAATAIPTQAPAQIPASTQPQSQLQPLSRGVGLPPPVIYRAPAPVPLVEAAPPQPPTVVNGTFISGVRVFPRPITIDTPYRDKEAAKAELAAVALPKPAEPAPKVATPESPPVIEVKPSAPIAAPAPLLEPPPLPPAAPNESSKAPPAPALLKPAAKNETPNPDSLGGLVSRRAVYYDFDAANLSDEYKAIIVAHAKYLAQNPKAKVKLRGNCDERGSREYNISLGSNRAESVKQLMVANGASAKQIEAESFGKEKPMAQGHDETSWAQNRRVDILYSEED